MILDILNTLAMNFDIPILNWIQVNLNSEILNLTAKFFTYIGNDDAIWILLTFIFCLLPRYRKTGFELMLSLIMCYICCDCILKPMVSRLRPIDFQESIGIFIPFEIEGVRGSTSFPSGHTLSAFVSAFIIIQDHKKEGWICMIAAILTGLSRIYLYAHYPTDVIASIILSGIIAIAVSWIVSNIQKRTA